MSSPQPTACPRCRAANPSGARFCGGCGAALETTCPRCAAATASGQRFCNGCGLELTAAPAAAPAAATVAAPADAGERRHATVVFSDLAGYTALTEANDPEHVESLRAQVQSLAATVFERHGGTVNQFVGDETMALFGVPLTRRDDAGRAVAAALELHEAVRTLGPAAQGTPLLLHTGIATGLVVVRRADQRAGDWTLTGDAVNVAARLRSLAAPGEVIVSGETWREIGTAFRGEPAAPVQLKGKSRPTVPWRIVGAAEPGAHAPGALVGRDDELAQLEAVAAGCRERGRGRVVVLRGDPGVGKSRLVDEFAARSTTMGDATHRAAVLDFGAETGRDAVRSLARSLLALDPRADLPARAEAARRHAEAHALAPERALFVFDLLDTPLPTPLRAIADAMDTTAREAGSRQAFVELVERAADAGPMLVVVEDIHWADEWTLARLAALCALTARRAVVFVMTTRFEADPTVGAWRTALHGAPLVTLHLAPLGAEDALRLAGIASRMPENVQRSCVERAEGNPLFLLQLLLGVDDAASSHLPGTIQALVHARMDRLPAADKSALQAAAVLGQRHDIEALRHLLESPAYDNTALVERFLVRPESGEFLFCHALIRDGAYASLLLAARRRLHARAGEWFATRDPALAADHYERAGHPDAAATYLAASRAASAQQRVAQALALAERGLRLEMPQSIRHALLLARARLLVDLGRGAEAVEAAETAVACADGAVERAVSLLTAAAAMRLCDRTEEGLRALDAAEPLCDAEHLDEELSRLYHLRGNLLFPLGRHAECMRAHEQALTFARRAGSFEAEAAAFCGLGDAHYLLGRMRSAHSQFSDGVELARRHGFGRLEVANLNMVGWTGMHLNLVAEASTVADEAIRLASRASHVRAELLSRMLSVWIDGMLRGADDSAEQHARQALPLAERLGAHRFEAQLRGCAAIIAHRGGDRRRALEQSGAALEICRQHGMSFIGPRIFGVCALVEDEPDLRRRHLDDGERSLAAGCVGHNHIWFHELAIEVDLDLCDWDAADAACERLLAYTAAEPLPYADFIAGRGRAMARHGRGERTEVLRQALAELRQTSQAAELKVAETALQRALDDWPGAE